MNPVQKLEQATANMRPRKAYSMMDATMLNLTLGLFGRAGIQAAVLNMQDADNPTPVRFDPIGAPGASHVFWPCVQDGRIFFYFDNFQMVAVIVKTSRRRLVLLEQDSFTPLFLAPIGPVLTGPVCDDYDSALEWIEQRYRRAEEVLPTLLANESGS